MATSDHCLRTRAKAECTISNTAQNMSLASLRNMQYRSTLFFCVLGFVLVHSISDKIVRASVKL